MIIPMFFRHIGIDYSGAEASTSRLNGFPDFLVSPTEGHSAIAAATSLNEGIPSKLPKTHI